MFFCKRLKAGTPYGDISGVFFSWKALYATLALVVALVLLGAALWHAYGPTLQKIEILSGNMGLSMPLVPKGNPPSVGTFPAAFPPALNDQASLQTSQRLATGAADFDRKRTYMRQYGFNHGWAIENIFVILVLCFFIIL